jgi:hypothetical protein
MLQLFQKPQNKNMKRILKILIQLLILQFLIFSCKTYTTKLITDGKDLFGSNGEGMCYTDVARNYPLSKCYIYISDIYRSNGGKNKRKHLSVFYTTNNAIKQFDPKFDNYQFMIIDTNIIYNYLFKFVPDSVKNEIIYSYSENRDTIFKQYAITSKDMFMIDRSKVITIVDRKVYCYPLIDTTFNYILLCNFMAPKEKVIEFMKLLNSEGYFYTMDPKVIGGIVVYIPFIDKPRTLNKKE